MDKKAMRTGKPIRAIGLMSGTSLDGLDICYAEFVATSNSWSYRILQAEEISYPPTLRHQLSEAQHLSAYEYVRLHTDYGHYLGQCVKEFIQKHKASPDFVASHGQTIFHQPELHFTAQIGSGAAIAATCGTDCICDFRTTDVAYGGQGAPLVPIGDRHLFGQYDYCLNLGGFSNISFENETTPSQRIAYDISPVNYVLNHYAQSLNIPYDAEGMRARKGKICQSLLEKLNALPYYGQEPPKSLGREWVETTTFPLIDRCKLTVNDTLATYTEHVAMQLSLHIQGGTVLVTGGGAYNTYLLERMTAHAPQCTYHVPDHETIRFKEALLFAFLGVLYTNNKANSLSSVTGAHTNSIGGALYKTNKKQLF